MEEETPKKDQTIKAPQRAFIVCAKLDRVIPAPSSPLPIASVALPWTR